MKKHIFPIVKPFSKFINLPTSKSITNRALLLAAVSSGRSIITNPLRCDDSFWCLESLKSLGVEIKHSGLDIEVLGNKGFWDHGSGTEINVGSAGTTGRFLTAILATTAKDTILINSSQQLARRPILPMLNSLRELGCKIDNDAFPLTIKEMDRSSTKKICMDGNTSSQFVSAIMMCAPFLSDQLTIEMKSAVVQDGYIDITIDVMRKFGVKVSTQIHDGLRSFIIPAGDYKPTKFHVELDYSTASYFLALAAATESEISIKGHNENSLQPDKFFLGALKKLGCEVNQTSSTLILKGPNILKGGFTIDMNDCSDTVLTLACLAPLCDAPIEIRNVAHIRHHECDRISAICECLRRGGIAVKEYDDGLKVMPGEFDCVELNTYDDHRVAMSLSVLGAASSGVILNGADCVSKTCPTFFALIRELGVMVKDFS